MEANAPNGAPMEKPNKKTMAKSFAMANEFFYQTMNKPPTSANVYKASDSNDETTISMNVKLATPSSNPSQEYISMVIIILIKIFKELFGIVVSVLKSLFQIFP